LETATGAESSEHTRPAVQQRTVSGRVTDDDGSPLEGVTVRVAETGAAASTDAEGNYNVPVAANDNTLTYTLMGFQPVESVIAERTVVNVTMSVAVSDLDEVVVVGYGTQRKRDVTGAITSLDTDDFNKSASVSLNQLMAGKAAGVRVVQ